MYLLVSNWNGGGMIIRRIWCFLLLAAALAQPAMAEVVTFTTRTTGLVPIQGIPGLFPGTSAPIPLELVLTSHIDMDRAYQTETADNSTLSTLAAPSVSVELTIGTVVYNYSSASGTAYMQFLGHGTGHTTLRHGLTLPFSDDGKMWISSGVVQEPAQAAFHTVAQLMEAGSGTLPNIYGSMYLLMEFGDGRSYVVRPEMTTFEFTAVSSVPEPSAYAMLVAGLLGFGVLARVRRPVRAAAQGL